MTWPQHILPKKYVTPYLTRMFVVLFLLPYFMGVYMTELGFLFCFVLFDLLEYIRVKGLIREGAL